MMNESRNDAGAVAMTVATDIPPFSELSLDEMEQNGIVSLDDDTSDLSNRLRQEALEAMEEEPEMELLLRKTVLADGVNTFEDAVAITVAYRLLGETGSNVFSMDTLRGIFRNAFESSHLELGHSMKEAVRQDVLAVYNRDPACQTILEVVLFFKGFAALVCHRAARQRWNSSKRKRSIVSLFLQSQASATFGVDIHPAATMGAGVLLDHGTGIVIGETAVVGNGCTLLHGVTLGGTGKETGNRHPKIGAHVLIGAGTSILGNVLVGDNAKIGAGSVVLRSIPPNATAVGAPAKIIGRVKEVDPAASVDEVLENVNLFHKQNRSPQRVDSNLTATTVSSETDSSLDGDQTNCMCPFRDLYRMGKSAPPNTVTFCTLSKLLKPHHIGSFEIGEIFFALDTDMVGFVGLPTFKESCAELVVKYCGLDAKTAQEIVEEYASKAKTEAKT